MDGYFYASFTVDALHRYLDYVDPTIVDTGIEELRGLGAIEVRERNGRIFTRGWTRWSFMRLMIS